MGCEEVWEKLTEIFRNNFEDEDLSLSESTTANDIEGWDSLEQINLIVAIQHEFSIKINIKESVYLKNVGQMVDLILKKINERKE